MSLLTQQKWAAEAAHSFVSELPELLRSEIVFVDVVLREDRWRPEENLAAVNDFELAKFTGVKLGIARLQLPVDNRAHRESGSVPQIDRIPQNVTLNSTALDERLHLIRSGLTHNRNLANQIGLRDRIGGRRESHTGEADNALDVGICLENFAGDLEGLLLIFLRRKNGNQFELRVGRCNVLLDFRYPGILAGGG